MSEVYDHPIRVIVVEDQTLINEGIRMLVERDSTIHVIAQAYNGNQAIEMAHSLHPDVILMDIRMPFVDGIQATQAIKHALPHTHVIILTSYDSPKHRFYAHEFGASEFLLKDIDADDLCATIREVAHHDTAYRNSSSSLPSTAYVSRTLNSSTIPHGSSLADEEFNELTQRERDVIIQIAEGETNEQVARSLHISVETVKTHIKHILPKIHATNRSQIVAFAYENALLYKYNPYTPSHQIYDDRRPSTH
ncbi:response regulator [Alloscardovia venturai]|uniref:Response regulator n=1 Tax=Alloscardovia venturai TaxID=1769421 RepID=A0ABW2Y3J6_9BIFI